MTPRILAFAGSSRTESFNKRLLAIAVSGAEAAGADVTRIDLADYPMPLFNQDLESEDGMPENALKFKRLLTSHDAFIIASPEYNSAFSPLLKNVIDWASRAESDDEPPLMAYQGKTAAILAASPGALGGLRGLVFLRMLLANIGVTVLPDQQAIPQAFKAFNDDGTLADDRKQQAVMALGRQLVVTVGKLNA
ncbi:MAG: NAD(P)H-dependent oxidoreductase [Candidatus Thiodiazotropha sp. (ex Myrtea spinifera)]|nr:NAD(P)H-dependent oxidoreductase [Candidatus Thiodiazotropha sp. (ex Myrtea spinifera)]MCU7827909.1 NAD(P)H-dependent oxidoreductase [Candidatus Thiodiazotropha sp. (ex Myrtea sp. 'scaly one' KF741663)]